MEEIRGGEKSVCISDHHSKLHSDDARDADDGLGARRDTGTIRP